MSIRNRARNVQKVTGLSYRKCVSELRALGAQPADLKRQFGWGLKRCDLFLVDPLKDPEYAAVASEGAVYVQHDTCLECGQAFFYGVDRKNMPTGPAHTYCPDCREEHGTSECLRCGGEVLGEDTDGFCESCQDFIAGQ